jgi:hypothetical protein
MLYGTNAASVSAILIIAKCSDMETWDINDEASRSQDEQGGDELGCTQKVRRFKTCTSSSINNCTQVELHNNVARI